MPTDFMLTKSSYQYGQKPVEESYCHKKIDRPKIGKYCLLQCLNLIDLNSLKGLTLCKQSGFRTILPKYQLNSAYNPHSSAWSARGFVHSRFSNI